MRILVTGSRDWTDEATVRAALARQTLLNHPDEKYTLVHGDARGLDRIAAKIAKEFDWEVEAYPADWERFGKAAGAHRNELMCAKGADVCLAFPLPQSRGTYDCARRAGRLGIRVVTYPPGYAESLKAKAEGDSQEA